MSEKLQIVVLSILLAAGIAVLVLIASCGSGDRGQSAGRTCVDNGGSVKLAPRGDDVAYLCDMPPKSTGAFIVGEGDYWIE